MVKYTVEFNGNKGWEIGSESEHVEQAILYMVHCMADGVEVRLTVESEEPDYLRKMTALRIEGEAFTAHLDAALAPIIAKRMPDDDVMPCGCSSGSCYCE
jgi:uncharacterized membrane protein YcgQ (UPF0703/DUF1980 family)